MPVLTTEYKTRPWYLFNGHLETIIPSLYFDVGDPLFERERLELEDGDFLDLDWRRGNNNKLIIFSHGLEGNSTRNYIKRPIRHFFEKGWDALAWNCRSCSGEMNRLPRLYHHGSSDDLEKVVNHALIRGEYSSIILAGYSMGGSLNIKYMGTADVPFEVKGSFNFSTPCDLEESLNLVEEKRNLIYKNKFMKRLRAKALNIAARFPDLVDEENLRKMKDFHEFHHHFTLPVLGIDSDDRFYEMASCRNFISSIKKPVFLMNAINDPMLGERCNPTELAESNSNFYLELPKTGGHLGFTIPGTQNSYMEIAAERFLNDLID